MSSNLRALLPLLLLATACSGAAGRPERLEPGPAQCKPGCNKFGNCGEDGFCRCPQGRLGEECEIDFLAPCKQFPDGHAYCGWSATKSCECMRRCKEFFCQGEGHEAGCDIWWAPPERACYTRKNVPAEEQYSRIPEEDEQGATYTGWVHEQTVFDRTEALKELNGEIESVPLSKCPDQCNKRGYCTRFWKDPNAQPFCRCHRGYSGGACETDDNRCYLKCNGKGTCKDQFCHCEPPYFSIGCSRRTVYPANHSQPSPVTFKIYMYELQTQLAYDREYFAGWQDHDGIYTSYQKFLEQFLLSPVRTEDPSEANMFFIPSFTYSYSGNVGNPQQHLVQVIDHLRMNFPYWNRTDGKDHFLWVPADQGACHLSGIAHNPIKLAHFGMHTTPTNHYKFFPHMGHPEWGCYNPLRDVVTPPFDGRQTSFSEATKVMSIDDILAKKSKLFFFAGGVRMDDKAYSGNTRQTLHALAKKWNDPEFNFVEGGVHDYEDQLRTSKFCLAPFGHGWGNRLMHAMLTACIPVIIQEHVYQAFEEVLPYETFSVRLNNADLPQIREILRSVTEEQYRSMMVSLLRYYPAFSWEAASGGLAYEYTIATLRRRYLNFKAMYY